MSPPTTTHTLGCPRMHSLMGVIWCICVRVWPYLKRLLSSSVIHDISFDRRLPVVTLPAGIIPMGRALVGQVWEQADTLAHAATCSTVPRLVCMPGHGAHVMRLSAQLVFLRWH